MLDLRSEFTFEGIARLSYGWENPNHAAAVIASGFAILWAVERNVTGRGYVCRGAIWLAELTAALAVALTYSRAGVIAAVAALVVFAGMYLRNAGRRQVVSFVCLRLAIFFAILAGTGLTRRFGHAMAGDASVGNRLDLWKGGLQLMDASRLSGWGRGDSGLAYMQWVQNPSLEVTHGGMTNSYLHIAVEQGAFGLMALLIVLVTPLLITCCRARSVDGSDGAMLAAAASGLVAFSIAGIFSTLWNVASVTWLPLSLIFLILLLNRSRSAWGTLVKCAGTGIGVAAVLCLAIYLAAMGVAAEARWQLRRHESGAVTFVSRQTDAEPNHVNFFPDRAVLGHLYGKEIRRSVDIVQGKIRSFTVYPPQVLPGPLREGTEVYFGTRAQLIAGQTLGRVYVVCPAVQMPTQEFAASASVFLPDYDEIGYAARWRRYAEDNRWRVHTVNGSGQDIRVQWASLFANLIIAPGRP